MANDFVFSTTILSTTYLIFFIGNLFVAITILLLFGCVGPNRRSCLCLSFGDDTEATAPIAAMNLQLMTKPANYTLANRVTARSFVKILADTIIPLQ